ncbi:MAG: hypothetical protein M1815_004135 [Lichina confinis]|nr:MAG: hypothetical protein M1815_004135 [Lichina confinis]
MPDLRRQVLESKKTVSRKALSRQSSRDTSPAPSRPASRSHSRNPSRQPSDEEDGNLSDETTWRQVLCPLKIDVVSVNSIDEMLASDEAELQSETWRQDLDETIEQILDRKRSSVAGREQTLTAFNRLATARYVFEELQGKTEQIARALLKSLKAKSSEKEASLALKALALIMITDPSDDAYELMNAPLKDVVGDYASPMVKAAAIHTLGASTFFGGAASSEVVELMDFLLQIVETDGASVDATDSGPVVTAALEEWGFLATQIEDLEQESTEAMEALTDQLQSSDTHVQVAAGEDIALLFEKSFTEVEDGESDPEDADEDFEADTTPGTPKLVKRYDVCRNVGQLKHRLSSLASVSGKRLSKKDKKSLHTNFADILNSVENPTRGPRYQNALNQETGKRYGSRLVVRIHRTGVMRIDKWWKLHRLRALRRILGGGFMVHYEKNSVVFESLP